MAYGQSVHTILYIPYPCHWFLYWIRCWKANWLHGYFVLLCFTTSALYACLGSRALKGKALTRQSRKFRTACAVSLDMWVIDNSDIITVHVQTVSFLFIYLFISLTTRHFHILALKLAKPGALSWKCKMKTMSCYLNITELLALLAPCFSFNTSRSTTEERTGHARKADCIPYVRESRLLYSHILLRNVWDASVIGPKTTKRKNVSFSIRFYYFF